MNIFDFAVVMGSVATILSDYHDGEPSGDGAGAG
jgi:hypothetical protein